MKKISLLLVTLFTIGIVWGTEYSTSLKLIDKSPIPNTNLTWTLYEDGTFVIEGEGDIPEYDPFSENIVWTWYKNYRNGITKIIIEDGVKSIGESTFAYYNILEELYISNSVEFIAEGAFSYCDKLANVTIGNSVKTLSKSAFYRCPNLTEIVLPKSLENIGIGVFAFDEKLTSLSIDADNQYFTTIDGVLYNKDVSKILIYPAGKTGEYVIPKTVNSIKEYAFFTCIGLISITIPETITTIEDFTFDECLNLTEVHLPATITKIGEGAFGSTENLKTITLPNNSGLTLDWAVFNLSGIETVTFPPSVEVINKYTFFDCQSLSGVSISSSIKSIEEQTFYQCYNLTSLLIDSDTPPAMNGDVFKNIMNTKNITLYVPAGMESNYSGYPWNQLNQTVVGVDISGIFGVAETLPMAAAGETKALDINTEGDTHDLFTKLNLTCQIEIGEENKEWLSAVATANKQIAFTATKNNSGAARSATVKLWLVSERNYHEISVLQEYEEEHNAIIPINNNKEGINVFGGESVIYIENAQGLQITLSDVSGRAVYSGIGNNNTVEIPVARGLYIAKIGQYVAKVLVK